MKVKFILLLLLIFTSIFAEKYTVIQNLNIRSSESKTSEIVGKLNKNAVIEGTDLGNGWIKLDNEKGFVNSVFVAEVKTSVREKSFAEIFKNSFFTICWIIAIIFSVLYSGFNTRKDRRYKKGYNPKQEKMEWNKGFIIGALFSLPISLLISLLYAGYKYYF